MKRLFIILMMMVASLVMSMPSSVRAELTDEIQAATVETALLWLEVVDQGRYDESWDQTSDKFKAAMGKEEWTEKLDFYREPLGKVKSRELLDKGLFESIPNHPGLRMMVLQFNSSFEDKEFAVETVSTVSMNGGPWQVAGYFISDSIDVKVQ